VVMGRKGKGKQANNNHKKEERNQRMAFRKRRNRNKYGDAEWNKDFAKFQQQLGAGGLTIKDVAGDGNCLFRAIADQLVDDPSRHAEFRKRIMDFVEAQREAFEPFVEDDIPFEVYVSDMRKMSSWGGHIEIQAFSLQYQCNVIIHQLDQPRWEVNNHDLPKKTIHLSYHDGDHYASVRTLAGGFPPEDVHTVAFATQIPLYEEPENDMERIVMAETQCTDINQVRKIIEDCQWDVDLAIATLLMMKDTALPEEIVSPQGASQNVYIAESSWQPVVQNDNRHHKEHPHLNNISQRLSKREKKIQPKIQKKIDQHHKKKNKQQQQQQPQEVEETPPVLAVIKDLGALCI